MTALTTVVAPLLRTHPTTWPRHLAKPPAACWSSTAAMWQSNPQARALRQYYIVH